MYIYCRFLQLAFVRLFFPSHPMYIFFLFHHSLLVWLFFHPFKFSQVLFEYLFHLPIVWSSTYVTHPLTFQSLSTHHYINLSRTSHPCMVNFLEKLSAFNLSNYMYPISKHWTKVFKIWFERPLDELRWVTKFNSYKNSFYPIYIGMHVLDIKIYYILI